MAYLVIHARGALRERALLRKASTIGRWAGCEVWANDPRLSREHCRIEPRGVDRWAITDLNSTNGTYVEGKRILLPHILGDEQTIHIGDLRLVFYEGQLLPQRPPDPLATLMVAGALRQRESEGTTMMGEPFSLVRPMPKSEEDLLVPRRRVQPSIPLPFTRPKPRPIVHA